MKARITFDTLAYANRLKAAGLASKIAETQAEANAELIASLTEDVLITKQDLTNLAAKKDLADFATKEAVANLDSKIDASVARLDSKIDASVAHLDSKINALDSKIDASVAHLDSKINALDSKIDASVAYLDSKFDHFATKEALARLDLKLDNLGTQLTLRLGGIVLGGLAGITAFFSHFFIESFNFGGPFMHVIGRERSTIKSSRQKVGEGLTHYLADIYLLYLKTQNFHWNVRGVHFYSLHKFFEELYQELAEAVDTVAERIRALHMATPASFTQFLKLTSLEEETNTPSAEEMLKKLLHDHQIITRNLSRLFEQAEHAEDEATVDLLTERMRIHEKTSWMLRSTLGQV